MIPYKNQTLLIAAECEDTRSLKSTWAGLGLAVLFLSFATLCASQM
ncbi:MAG: hypothetical protein ABGW81_08695 [Paracoccaceae bacterium]